MYERREKNKDNFRLKKVFKCEKENWKKRNVGYVRFRM